MKKLEQLGLAIAGYGIGFTGIIGGVEAMAKCYANMYPAKPIALIGEKEQPKPDIPKTIAFGAAATVLGGTGIACIAMCNKILDMSLSKYTITEVHTF